MNLKIVATTFAFTLGILSLSYAGHDHHDHNELINSPQVKKDKGLTFIKNNRQWGNSVLYRANINGGFVWLENNRMTYAFLNAADVDQFHKQSHDKDPIVKKAADDLPIHGHIFNVTMEGANLQTVVHGEGKQATYNNYYIGNDPAKWASMVPLYKGVHYSNVYKGVDLKVYSAEGNYKYDFVVAPNADVNQIRLSYQGQEALQLDHGNLIVQTSVTDIVEQKPYAYQVIDGKKVQVLCNYKLDGTRVSFEFPAGYDKNKALIIDPTVIASTYSGSTATIYGHTATYDNAGNIFSAGAGFDPGGLPTTVGAFQTTYGGGREVCLNKYNPDGSVLIYSTYVGGAGDDFPHSLVANGNDELYILGTSVSADYPTTAGAIDETFNGGGTGGDPDFVVTKLNVNGTALIGSTYIGGAGSDGQSNIAINYGDQYRGEIIVDASDNVYVSSVSRSSDFPVTAGAFQTTHGGQQDGVVFKMNSTLTSLTWATYLGGALNDAAYGIKIHDDGDIYVSGSAGDSNFPSTPGSAFPNYIGGANDGFVVELSPDGSTMNNGTFFGTAGQDQNFFIQIDRWGDVFVMGQSDNAVTATPGAYVGPNTGSYVFKIDPDLSAVSVVTTYGNFAPTAFLVDECDNIYVAGHGGVSALSGFDVTADAIQATGAGFYLMVLQPDAAGLLFGTYYGNAGAHVDGGTSRFDRRGVVYENCCSSPGSPTTAWSYDPSTTVGWDSYVFKIDMEQAGVIANANANPGFIGCAPFDVTFSNNGGVSPDHFWDFGDGNTSTDPNPNHTYVNPGNYTVMYVAIDSNSCNLADTAYVTVVVNTPQSFSASLNFDPWDPCDPIFNITGAFTGTGADSIVWDLGDGNTIVDTAINYTYADTGTYIITMTAYDNACGNVGTITDTITFYGGGIIANADASPNQSGCLPFTVQFSNNGGTTPDHFWDFGDGNTSTDPNPQHTYTTAGIFDVMYIAIDTASCNGADTSYVTVTVDQPLTFSASLDYVPGDPCTDTLLVNFDFTGTGADSLIWYIGGDTIYNTTSVSHTYQVTGTYTVTLIAMDLTCNNTETITQTVVHEGGSVDNQVLIPNVFTPNADGINDFFTIFYPNNPNYPISDDMEVYEMTIFNRWGRKVFEASTEEPYWDGQLEDNTTAEGVYYYIIKYKAACVQGAEEVEVTGHVSVLR